MITISCTSIPDSAFALASVLKPELFSAYVVCIHLAQRGKSIEKELRQALALSEEAETDALLAQLEVLGLLVRESGKLQVAKEANYSQVANFAQNRQKILPNGGLGGINPPANSGSVSVPGSQKDLGIFPGEEDPGISRSVPESQEDPGISSTLMCESRLLIQDLGISEQSARARTRAKGSSGENAKPRKNAKRRASTRTPAEQDELTYTRAERDALVNAIAHTLYGPQEGYTSAQYSVVNMLLTHITQSCKQRVTLELWNAYLEYWNGLAWRDKPANPTIAHVRGPSYGFVSWLASYQSKPKEEVAPQVAVVQDASGIRRLVFSPATSMVHEGS